MRGLTTAASLWATAAIGMAVGAGYLFGAAATTVLAMATLYALRSFRSSVIYPLRLDSAGLEITLKEPGSGPQAPRHTVRKMDAEIDEERARYKLQVRFRGDQPASMIHTVRLKIAEGARFVPWPYRQDHLPPRSFWRCRTTASATSW